MVTEGKHSKSCGVRPAWGTGVANYSDMPVNTAFTSFQAFPKELPVLPHLLDRAPSVVLLHDISFFTKAL